MINVLDGFALGLGSAGLARGGRGAGATAAPVSLPVLAAAGPVLAAAGIATAAGSGGFGAAVGGAAGSMVAAGVTGRGSTSVVVVATGGGSERIQITTPTTTVITLTARRTHGSAERLAAGGRLVAISATTLAPVGLAPENGAPLEKRAPLAVDPEDTGIGECEPGEYGPGE